MTRPTERAVASPDDERLPWLADTPRRHSRGSTVKLVGGIASGFFVLAGAGYWAGLRSAASGETQAGVPASGEASVSLPEARVTLARTEDQSAAAPPQELSSSAATPRSETATKPPADAPPKVASPAKVATTAVKEPPLALDPYVLWPANKVEGADGRLVRIGNFPSEGSAREGWDKILGEYPGMARLKTTMVSGRSLRDGHVFYRLQVGTSSQAHSDVVCERSRGLGLDCRVIGLIVTNEPVK